MWIPGMLNVDIRNVNMISRNVKCIPGMLNMDIWIETVWISGMLNMWIETVWISGMLNVDGNCMDI